MNKFVELLRENIIIQGLISLVLVCGLVYLYASGRNVPSEFITVVMIVIGFYFGSKVGKYNQDNKK